MMKNTLNPTRWALMAGAAALVAGLTLGTSIAQDKKGADDKSKPAAATKPALTVTVVQAQSAQWAQTLVANGSLHAWQEASVGAEANGWRLAEVLVNVGDRVTRGQVLARFAPEMVQADLAQVRASVAEAEAALAEARTNAQRARDLQTTGALSQQQITQMLTMESTALARLEAARAGERVQQLRLRQTQVLAPDAGIISARSATVGAVVPAGQELFRLIRQGRLEWRAEVPAAELARVRVGQAVEVTPQGGSAVVGSVRMVAPTVDAATRNGLVYVDVKDGTGSAKAGMFARGSFDVGQAAALSLPQTAVLLRDGFSYVFKLEANNQVTQSKVTVGRRLGNHIEITGGLPPGVKVVAQGAGFLADGDTVRVVDAPPVVAPPKPVTAAATTTTTTTTATTKIVKN